MDSIDLWTKSFYVLGFDIRSCDTGFECSIVDSQWLSFYSHVWEMGFLYRRKRNFLWKFRKEKRKPSQIQLTSFFVLLRMPWSASTCFMIPSISAAVPSMPLNSSRGRAVCISDGTSWKLRLRLWLGMIVIRGLPSRAVNIYSQPIH